MQCPNCDENAGEQVEMTFIKGGISKKTGKPYKAFYSCPKCKSTANPDQVFTGEIPHQPNKVITDTQSVVRKTIPSSEPEERLKSMILSYAKDCAISMQNKNKDEIGGWSEEVMLGTIERLANGLWKVYQLIGALPRE